MKIGKKLLNIILAFILTFSFFAESISYFPIYAESNSTIVEENVMEDANTDVATGDNISNTKTLETGNVDATVTNNPDHITGPEKPYTGLIVEDAVSPKTVKKAASRSLIEVTPDWVTNKINPTTDLPQPGDVKVYEPEITEDSVYANLWKVRMLVAARDSVKTSNIVLVIDKSGSMNDNSRMAKAKVAANQFVDNVLDNTPNTKIAVVTFDGDPHLVSNFSNDKATLATKINGIQVGGGTFTQAGIREARNILKQSTADKKYMVLLSDGEPTYGYSVRNPQNYLVNGYVSEFVPENQFTLNRIGDGTSMTLSYWSYIYHFGNSAIAEAGFAKNTDKIDKLFTIGLETNSEGSNVLKKAASSPSDFYEAKSSDLNEVFGQIGSSIIKATNEAKVDVEFNHGFMLPKGITADKIDHSKGSTITIENSLPKWNIGTISTPLNESTNPGVKYEFIEFTTTINDQILDNADNTNINPLGNVSFVYKDQNGQLQTKAFPEAKVSPKLYITTKQIKNEEGDYVSIDDDKRIFRFQVEEQNGSTWSPTEVLEIGNGKQKIANNLKKGANYRVYELEKAKAYNNDNSAFKEFNVTDYYNVRESYYDNAVVNGSPIASGISTPIQFTVINGTGGDKHTSKVVNAEKTGNKAKATMTKTIEQINGTTSQALGKVFSINLTRKSSNDNQPIVFDTKEGTPVTKDVDFTEYYVNEKMEGVEPFYPKAGEQNKVVKITLYDVLAGGEKGQPLTFVNQYDNNKLTEVQATKKWVNGPSADHKAVTLNLYREVTGQANSKKKVTGVNPVITPEGTSDTINYVWKDLLKVDPTTGAQYIYSVEEDGVVDGKVTVNNHIYSVDQTGNTITNTYSVPKITTITAKKHWEDNEKLTRPEVSIKLHRKTQNGTVEDIPGTFTPSTLITENDKTYTWDNLDKSDANGNEYTYYLTESFKTDKSSNANWTIAPQTDVSITESNGKFVGTATLTNRAVTQNDAKGVIKIEKVLKYEKEVIPTSVLDVRSNSVFRSAPLSFLIEVRDEYGNKTQKYVVAGVETEISGLYYGKYTIEEKEAHGYIATYSPTSVDVVAGAEAPKFTVINSQNDDPNTVVNKTVTKVWEGGLKPETRIDLFAKGMESDGTTFDKSVGNFTATATTLSKEFTGLPKHDAKGNEIEYYAKEITPPANYKATISDDKLTITNTYNSPKITDITVKKHWTDKDNVTRPDVEIKLHRQIEGGAVEDVEGSFVPNPDMKKNDETYSWKNLDQTNKDGIEYKYFVTEEFKAYELLNANWNLAPKTDVVLADGQDGNKTGSATLTNSVIDENDKKGAIKIVKEIDNTIDEDAPRSVKRASAPLEFKVKVIDQFGNESEEKTIRAGQTVIFENLYYGEYSIIETTTHGYIPNDYETVRVEKGKEIPVFKLINKHSPDNDPNIVSVTVNKVWNGGTKPETKIELWREGKNADGSKVDEKVADFTASATVTKNVFSKLPKHDKSGSEFTYYAKEPNVPTGYTAKYSDDRLTVTNTFKNNDRVDGDDRIETSIAISKEFFDKSKYAIIAREDLFPDSLTATVLAKQLKAPILLTNTKKLDYRVKEELTRLGAKEIIISGGPASVSEAVKAELGAFDKDVERLAGSDRYETSVKIANRVVELVGKSDKVVIASGEVFPDALSVSPFAAYNGYPILLVKHKVIPKTVQNNLVELKVKNTFVVGGTNTISKDVEKLLPTVLERLGGRDRYGTSVKIAESKFENSERAFVASGEVFADALVVGAVAGDYNAPLLLTSSNKAPKVVRDYVIKSKIKYMTVIGGKKYIPEFLAQDLISLLHK